MVVLGASVPITRQLLHYPPATGQAMRYGLGAVALALVVVLVPGLGRGTATRTRLRLGVDGWLALSGMAALGLAGFNLCLLLALAHAEPAVVASVVGCAPLGLAITGPLLRGRDPAPRVIAAAAIVVIGTMLVHGAGRADTLGPMAAAGALIGDMAFSLLAAKLVPRLGPVRVAAYGCALAVPILATVAVISGEYARWRLPTPAEATVIAFLGLVLTAATFAAWFHGLSLIGVDRAGVLTGAVPVTTAVVAGVQDAHLPPPGQVVGLATVVIGLVLAMTVPGKPPAPYPSVSRPATAAGAGLAAPGLVPSV
jgi:drug/metabolite transporter (DMT)-like permease